MLFHQDVPFAEFAIFDKVATIAIYITIALILAVTVIGFLVKKKNQQLMPQFAWTATGLAFGYAIGLISVLLFLKLDEYIAVGYIDKLTFWPVLSLLILAIALAIVGLVISIFKKERFKLFTKIALGILSVGLAIILITNAITMYKGAEVAVGSEVQLYVYTALIAAAIAVIALACGKKSDADNTRSIVYASICIAMSFALSYLRLFELPSGGSITFASLLPLMIYSYKFGIRKGVQAGIIYGVLQFIQAPWFYHPVQFLLDYPIAFAAIGLTAVFKELKILENKKVLQFALGAIVAVTLRYLSHVVSGVFVFGSGDPENYSAIAWSFLYNSFAYADMAIALVAGCSMFASKSFQRLIEENK